MVAFLKFAGQRLHWEETHPDTRHTVVPALLSEAGSRNLTVGQHFRGLLHDHDLDDPALIEMGVEACVPLRVNCLLLLHDHSPS